MKRCLTAFAVLVIAFSFLATVGCKKKTTPAARAPVSSTDRGSSSAVDVPAPTIELGVSPTTINRGEQATLTWSSSNADSVVIDSGVGNVATEGSVTVTPLESTTYTATAVGRGGQRMASSRITVIRGDEPVEISETDVDGLQRAIEEGLVNPVFFAYDSADLTPEAVATLEENSKWFRRYPGARIIVEGHCDERGTEEYNLALGDRRAQAALDRLVQLGISADRLEGVSFGEERPFVQGSSESAWSQNRRAHFTVR